MNTHTHTHIEDGGEKRYFNKDYILYSIIYFLRLILERVKVVEELLYAGSGEGVDLAGLWRCRLAPHRHQGQLVIHHGRVRLTQFVVDLTTHLERTG